MCRDYLNENSWWRLIMDPALAMKPYLGCHMPAYQGLVYIRLLLLCWNDIFHVSPFPDVTTIFTINFQSQFLFCVPVINSS